METQKNKVSLKFSLFGEQFSKSFESKSRADFFVKCINSIKADKPLYTVSEGFKKYIDLELPKKTKTSQAFDICILKRLEGYLNLKTTGLLNDVDFYVIEEFQSHLMKKMTKASVNRNFNTIKHCFKKLYNWGYISHYPCNIVKLKETPTTITLWTLDDFKAVHDELILRQDKLILTIMWNTGARLKSIVELKKNDIDLFEKTIRFFTEKTKGQTRRSYLVPINKTLQKKLLNYKGLLSRQVLFLTSKNNPYTARYYRKKTSRLIHIKNNGLRLHHIRHTFANKLQKEGANIDLIARFLGHQSSLTTKKYLKDDLDLLRNHLYKKK